MTNFVLHITRNSAYRSDCTVSIFIQRTIIRLILCFPFLQCFMDRQVVHLLMQWDDHQTSLDQYYIKICSKWHHLLAHFYIQTTALIVYLTKNWTDLCMPYCSSRANCQICGKHFVLMKVKTVSTSKHTASGHSTKVIIKIGERPLLRVLRFVSMLGSLKWV